jgi:hypothetical protein
MIQSCIRCGGPGAAVLSFNYDDRAVWLDDLVTPLGPGEGHALCALHANRMTPPLGWTLTDHRTTTRLFAPLEVA